MNTVLTAEHLAKGITYGEYLQLITDLLANDKTTGDNHSQTMLDYTILNLRRMTRLDKTIGLHPDLLKAIHSLSEPWEWVVLTEAWCGDAAQNIPLLAKIAEAAPTITLRLLLRDENLDVMDAYLTNGGRGIPKLICLKPDTLEEIGTWGPRPRPAQTMMEEFKANPNGRTYADAARDAQTWYAHNKTQTLQREMIALFQQWKQTVPQTKA